MSIWGRTTQTTQRTYALVCGDCGADFEATMSRAKRCPVCRQDAHRESQAASNQRQQLAQETRAHRNWERLRFEIVGDPSGDFQLGARLTDVDIEYSLKYGSLPTGMQVRDRQSGLVRTVLAMPNGQLALNQPHQAETCS